MRSELQPPDPDVDVRPERAAFKRLSDARTADSHIISYSVGGGTYFDVHAKSQCNTGRYPDCDQYPDTHASSDSDQHPEPER